jgi:CheY-like chemotaxis protein
VSQEPSGGRLIGTSKHVKGFQFQEARGNRLMTSNSPVNVLVVEDDFLSRLHAVNLVEDAGYVAVEAFNADEAIRILETRKDIRIVFTDIDMPGSMDGLKLAQAIRKRWPPIELILTSGHFTIRDDEIPERGQFFSKPYVDKEIISALHQFGG